MREDRFDTCFYCGKKWPPCHLILMGSEDIHHNLCCPGCDPFTMEPANLWQCLRSLLGLEYTTKSGDRLKILNLR